LERLPEDKVHFLALTTTIENYTRKRKSKKKKKKKKKKKEKKSTRNVS
jgi:hypothetical protein